MLKRQDDLQKTHNKRLQRTTDYITEHPVESTILTSTLAAMKRQVMPMSCSVDLNTFLCVAMKRSK